MAVEPSSPDDLQGTTGMDPFRVPCHAEVSAEQVEHLEPMKAYLVPFVRRDYKTLGGTGSGDGRR